jgi:transposase
MEEKKPAIVLKRRDSAGKKTLEIHRLGPHPIIQHFLEHLAVARILDKHIHSARDGVVSHGTTIAFLVHNVLLSRDPLYRLSEWCEGIEPRALGLTNDEKLALNDDRVGRALEQLAEFGGRGVFFQLALRAIKLYKIETQRIHFDTTTVTFSGEYQGSSTDPRITYGKNKDHRPDLKQLLFGLNVTSDGAVPVLHGVWSGNQSDDTLHTGNFDALRDLLEKSDFIYVADCKLASEENMKHISSFGGLFVTVLPRTRKEDMVFRDGLRKKAGRWKMILTVEVSGTQGATESYYSSDGPTLSKEGFRLLWIKSSAKAAQDKRVREEGLVKAKAELQELRGGLNKRELKAGTQIRNAIKKILKAHGCEAFLSVKLQSEVRTKTKRLRAGRPKKADGFQYVSDTLYDFKVKDLAVPLRKEANTDGVFPLITNLPEKSHKALDVLQIYRYQPYIERRFENLKTEYAISPVYLKKPERVVGLLHVYFIAMMVAALIERELRKNMAKEKIASLPIYPEERECKAPTSPRIFGTFSQVDWYKQIAHDGEAAFPVKLTDTQAEILSLLGLPRKLYEGYPFE